MTSRVIKSSGDVVSLIELLKSRNRPYTVTIKKGVQRSLEQNRLQWLWMNEAAEQLGEYTPLEYQVRCKLELGIPMLRGEDQDFRELYDKTVKPLSYADKIALMDWFPVTSLMTTGQKKRYLDDVYIHFTGLGVQLTEPDN